MVHCASLGCKVAKGIHNQRGWSPSCVLTRNRHDRIVSYEPRYHVVLHQPEIPQNTGNIGRTCLALHAKLWLVRPLGFRVDEHHLRRAGLDYWQHLVWETVEDWPTLVQRLPEHRMWFLSKHAKHSYTKVQYSTNDVFVFGSETSGLPSSIMESYQDKLLRIPMHEPVRSLNLSNAVAIVMYEADRQLPATT